MVFTAAGARRMPDARVLRLSRGAWASAHVPAKQAYGRQGKIENLIATRLDARKAKNFAESDRIRDELAAMGVVLKDSKDGTTWEIAR